MVYISYSDDASSKERESGRVAPLRVREESHISRRSGARKRSFFIGLLLACVTFMIVLGWGFLALSRSFPSS